MVNGKVEFYGTGRRKCAVAKVRVCEGTGKVLINNKEIIDFCSIDEAERKILNPLIVANVIGKVDVKAETLGGGIMGQIGAISLGISRALEKMNPELRPALKAAGLLTRDGRCKERKKPGRPGARKRFQFSKR